MSGAYSCTAVPARRGNCASMNGDIPRCPISVFISAYASMTSVISSGCELTRAIRLTIDSKCGSIRHIDAL